jgi:hypothetical protein
MGRCISVQRALSKLRDWLLVTVTPEMPYLRRDRFTYNAD